MSEFFEIFGSMIPFKEIKSFRIVQKEYIYRPVYRECHRALFGSVFGEGTGKYEFAGMQPYAAIVDEKGAASFTSGIQVNTLKKSIRKDLFEDVRTTIGDKFNVKSIRAKKYTCRSQTGRVFSVYLEDVPALVCRVDGKQSDVMKNDELYPLLGEPIAPVINIVQALWINTSEEFLFYGDGIQLIDVVYEFKRLKEEFDEYKMKEEESKVKLPFGKLSGKSLVGKFKNKEGQGTVENDLIKLKQAYKDGVLTKEEYEEKVAKVLDKV